MNTAHKHSRSRWQWVSLVITILVLTGAMGAGAISWSWRRAATKPSLTDLTVPVQAKALAIRVEASGKVQPIESVNIGAEGSGRLVALYADQGDKVKAGQVLGRMRTAEKDAALAEARGQLAQAQADYAKTRNGSRSEEIARARAQVASAQAQLDLSTKKLKRYRSLAQEGAISQKDLDEYIQAELSASANLQQNQQQLQELTTGSRPEDIELAAAKVASARAKIKEVEAQLDATVIRAPFDGVVTQKYATIGAIITPAMPGSGASATPGSILELSSGLEVLVDVPEASISWIKVGQPVKIIADSYPNRSFQGQVRQIAPKAVAEDDVTSFQVQVKLVTGQLELLSGMNVDAIFMGKSITNALTVPTVAITNRDNQMGVLVADREGKARFQPVTVGSTQDGQTQILKGLKSGERVFIDFPESKNSESSKAP